MGEPGDDPFTDVLIGFTHELRTAGLTVGTGDVLTYFAAMTPLDPTDLVDLYWAGRATLVTRRDDISVYDEVFRRFFTGAGNPLPELVTITARTAGAGSGGAGSANIELN